MSSQEKSTKKRISRTEIEFLRCLLAGKEDLGVFIQNNSLEQLKIHIKTGKEICEKVLFYRWTRYILQTVPQHFMFECGTDQYCLFDSSAVETEQKFTAYKFSTDKIFDEEKDEVVIFEWLRKSMQWRHSDKHFLVNWQSFLIYQLLQFGTLYPQLQFTILNEQFHKVRYASLYNITYLTFLSHSTMYEINKYHSHPIPRLKLKQAYDTQYQKFFLKSTDVFRIPREFTIQQYLFGKIVRKYSDFNLFDIFWNLICSFL